jgi:hypothetical protein
MSTIYRWTVPRYRAPSRSMAFDSRPPGMALDDADTFITAFKNGDYPAHMNAAIGRDIRAWLDRNPMLKAVLWEAKERKAGRRPSANSPADIGRCA